MQKNKIPFHLTKDINSEISFNWIKSLNADIIFCFGWSNLLKKYSKLNTNGCFRISSN